MALMPLVHNWCGSCGIFPQSLVRPTDSPMSNLVAIETLYSTDIDQESWRSRYVCFKVTEKEHPSFQGDTKRTLAFHVPQKNML